MSRQSTDTAIRGISKKEGDRIADMVLRLVRALVDERVEANRLAPTGTGHLPPEMRQYVDQRSA